jgi:hypothetical protein
VRFTRKHHPFPPDFKTIAAGDFLQRSPVFGEPQEVGADVSGSTFLRRASSASSRTFPLPNSGSMDWRSCLN